MCPHSSRQAAWRFALIAVFLLPGAAEASRAVSGTVFIDRDGNGLLSEPDEVFSNGFVFWESTQAVALDERGAYSLTAPDQFGIIWVLARDGLDPGPFWAEVPAGGERTIDIPVRPVSVSGPLQFVVASDTHAGINGMPASDQAFVLHQATRLEPRPHFIAVTGDITQSNQPDQFATVLDAIATLDTPYVPVPGNHDWYDGGAAYRKHFGPPTYSFNAGGVHFIVLNDADSVDARAGFVQRELAFLGQPATAVAMMHAPPGADLVAALEELGVDMLLTGHLHANRVLLHDTLVEYNTQPLAMGGIDLTPAGYRVFTLDADGSLRVDHRTIVDKPVLRVVSPAADQVVEECRVPVLVGLEPGQPVVSLDVRAPGLDSVPLAPLGGWIRASEEPLRLCEPGTHRIMVEATLADGEILRETVDVQVGDPPAVGEISDWPALQGSSRHLGWSPSETGFPLRTQWIAAVGGHIQGGSPVVAGGRVFVSVSDFGEGVAGGVVALDAATGQQLWERRVGFSVRNAPAVAEDVLVFASSDATLHAASAATGEELWSYVLAPGVDPASRSMYSAPVIDKGVVYAGVAPELVALDLQTGELRWSTKPVAFADRFAAHVTPAVAGNRLVVSFDRGAEGLLAFDTRTGELVWQTGPEPAQGMQGSPVIDHDTVYVVNEVTRVSAIDLGTGQLRWTRQLDESAFTWGYAAVATPSVHRGVLYLATQSGDTIALDAATGRERWSAPADTALVRTRHYRGEVPACAAAPALTPGLVWSVTPSGSLRALFADDGQVLWSMELGVPILSSPVPAGALMFVAGYDGTVRALATNPEVDLPRPRRDGCGAAGEGPATAALVLAGLFLRLAARRRRRPAVEGRINRR